MHSSNTTAGGRPAASSASEGSGYAVADDKKRRRKESNRESARRSRQKKQQHLDDLIREVGNLKRENEQFAKKIDDFCAEFSGVEAQNKVLRAEKERLVRRLESLESMIEIAKVVRGKNVNGGEDEGLLYEISSDPMMKPWQLPCPSSSMPAIVASSSSSSGLRRSKFYA